MKTVPVKIKWYTQAEGGRRVPPPAGTQYRAVIRIEGKDIGSWSIQLNDFTMAYWKSTANLGFIFEEAPFAELKSGVKFYLMEGRNDVAEGIVQYVKD